MLIEVAYALPERAIVKSYLLQAPASVDDALALAAADPDFAGVDFGAGAGPAGGVGIFGRIVRGDTPLADGDRVEIYRPLSEDPRSARRRRAGASRSGRS